MDVLNPWYAVTVIGDPKIWLILTGMLMVVYFIVRKRLPRERRKKIKRGVRFFVISIWVVTLATFFIKYFVDIQRPCNPCVGNVHNDCNPYCLEDPSFPSGHTSIIFAVFSSFYLIRGKKKFLPLFIVPVMVGLSRITLGVHNPIDVFAGMLIGLIIPIAVFEILENFLRNG